jgi:signal peptidase II
VSEGGEAAGKAVTAPAGDGQAGSIDRPRWGLFAGLGGAVLVVDQLVKAWIVGAGTFQVGRPVEIAGDFVRITLSHNQGALFGMFQGSALLFALVSLAVLGIIVWYEARAGQDLVVSLALGLLIGGAIGNLIDRLRLGYVVDFVDAGIGGWRWYTFNVADAAISTAILLLIILAVWPQRATAA